MLSLAGCFPMITLARMASADHVISPEWSGLLRSSQHALAICLVAAGCATPWIMVLHRMLRRAIMGLGTGAFLSLAAGLAGATAVTLHYTLLQGVPHVTDEISHLFQSKILLAGAFHAHAPPCPQLFFQHHIYITPDGRWFSIYPPGHALLLAIAGRWGLSALVVPAAFAISTAALGWLAHAFLRTWMARRFTLLFVLCPLNWLLGASYMSHFTFMAAFSVGLALFTCLARETGSALRRLAQGSCAGLCLATAGLIRPQDLVLAGAMTGLVILLTRARSVPHLLARAAWMLPGILPPLALQLLWNAEQYGKALAMGYAHSVTSLTPMLKPYYGFSATFGVRRAIEITGWTLLRLNKCLLGWPSSLMVVPLACWPPRRNARSLAAGLSVCLPVGFYFMYFYHGTEYEARFYHIAVPALLYLVLRGVDRLTALWRAAIRRRGGAHAALRARAAVVTLCAAAWLHSGAYYFPSYIWPKYSDAYEQASPAIHDAAVRAGLQASLVLVPSEGEDDFRYSSGFMWNDPALTSAVIYARVPANTNCDIMAEFPGRSIYRFRPAPGWRGGEFELLRGAIDTAP